MINENDLEIYTNYVDTHEEWVDADRCCGGFRFGCIGFLTPFVEKEYPMENVQKAHANVLRHPWQIGPDDLNKMNISFYL